MKERERKREEETVYILSYSLSFFFLFYSVALLSSPERKVDRKEEKTLLELEKFLKVHRDKSAAIDCF